MESADSQEKRLAHLRDFPDLRAARFSFYLNPPPFYHLPPPPRPGSLSSMQSATRRRASLSGWYFCGFSADLTRSRQVPNED